MRTVHGADVAHCSFRASPGRDGTLWPSTARQSVLRRWNEDHPRYFCQQPTVAILSVWQIENEGTGTPDWEAALCDLHLKQYEHLDGHEVKAPKMPTRDVFIVLAREYAYLETERPVRQVRSWAPGG